MRRVLAAAGALALLGAAPAGAVIVPQQGMAGIRLGMTQAQVRAAAGAPASNTSRDDDIVGPTRVYRYPTFTAQFDGKGTAARVFSVYTKTGAERTKRGIGVGSRRADVAAKVPGVTCKRESGLHHCIIGKLLPGRTITDFLLNGKGRVKSVVVGIVVD
jgi:hypothetical protein